MKLNSGQMLLIAKAIQDKLDRKSPGDNFSFSYNVHDKEERTRIKDVGFDFECRNLAISVSVNNNTGHYRLSIWPWQDRELKKVLFTVRHLVLNKQELHFTDQIHKVFPNLMIDAFEKDVMK